MSSRNRPKFTQQNGQQSDGVRIVVPREAASMIQIVMFTLICIFVGAILTFFVMIKGQTNEMGILLRQQEIQVRELAGLIKYYQKWKELVDERFTEQASAVRRLEFLMKVPSHERRSAVEQYDDFLQEELQ